MFFSYQLIRTTNKIIKVRGKVLYNDRKRKINLKKPIMDLFDSTSNNIHYAMELCLSKDQAIKRVKQLIESDVIPVLLYFMQIDGDKKDGSMP